MLRIIGIAAASCALAVAITENADAASTNCPVNAGTGYVDCLSFLNPGLESVRALHTSGRPYRFRLHRPSTSSYWGWWEYNDTNRHIIPLALNGTIVGQVNNRGSGTPSVYNVVLE